MLVKLINLGANVYGISKDRFNKLYLSINKNLKKKNFFYFNLIDFNKTKKIISKVKPDIIIHMAAQSLVRKSYNKPYMTFNENLISTLNILETSLHQKEIKSIFITTSDKCYENLNLKNKKFNESDKLGGNDPYSGSKAATEIMINSYLKSFYYKKKIGLASARSGNVIGGGDWSEDRLIPDLIRSIETKKKLIIRYPLATRPWQHVIDLNNGYIKLIEKLYKYPNKFSGSWNFGPKINSKKNVQDIVKKIKKTFFKELNFEIKAAKDYSESLYLSLNSSKTEDLLGWINKFSLNQSLNLTISWYYSHIYDRKKTFDLIQSQLNSNKI